MNELRHHAATPSRVQTQVDYLLLDGSGSMYGQWWDVLASLEAYLQGLRAARVNSKVMLAVFDTTDLHCIQRDVSLDECESLTGPHAPGMHGGGTPLYDAIAETGRRLRDMDPPRASVIIATDGDETLSKYTDVNQARAIIKWMEAKGWSVTFIGCDWNNSKLASRLGIRESAAIGVGRQHLIAAAESLAKKRARHYATGEQMHFSDDERQQFGGHLPAPRD
jgi:hypothetical protein